MYLIFVNQAEQNHNLKIPGDLPFAMQQHLLSPQLELLFQLYLHQVADIPRTAKKINHFVNLEQFETDPYKDKKLQTITWGRIPFTKRNFSRSSPEKDSFMPFRKELEQICEEVLNFKKSLNRT